MYGLMRLLSVVLCLTLSVWLAVEVPSVAGAAGTVEGDPDPRQERLLSETVQRAEDVDKTTFKGYVAVDNYVDVRQHLRSSSARQELVVFYTSLNVTFDPYFDLYAAWVNEMVQPDKFLVLNLVGIAGKGQEERLQRTEEYFSLLGQEVGPNVLFMVVTHGQIVMNYALLNDILVSNNRPPLNIFVLNHEQPWVADDERRRDNAMLSNSIMSDVYRSMGLVLRNYFYEPLQSSSFYVPLGPQKYSEIVGNTTHSIMQTLKPLSQRTYGCLFAGRFLYVENSFLHAERWAMKGLIDSEQLSCHILWDEAQNLQYSHTVDYEDYMRLMGDTVFVPCPAGNNPETFRHYEALEVGSIPLIVRPSPLSPGDVDGGEAKLARDLDFLHFWEGYPGPILSSWSDAEAVMTALVAVPGALDKLQVKVQDWYKSFKALTQRRIASITRGRMELRPQRPAPASHEYPSMRSVDDGALADRLSRMESDITALMHLTKSIHDATVT